jgi:hypothetical protein
VSSRSNRLQYENEIATKWKFKDSPERSLKSLNFQDENSKSDGDGSEDERISTEELEKSGNNSQEDVEKNVS